MYENILTFFILFNMRLKRYKKRRISRYISIGIWIIVISLICSFLVINYFSKKVNEIMLPMAESKVRKVVTRIINSAIDEDIIEGGLYSVDRDSNGDIGMVSYNSFLVTRLINDVTENIENMIRDIEDCNIDNYGDIGVDCDGVISEIPFGVIFGSSLLNNIGPKVKIRLYLIGDVVSNIETEVKPYGINNAYIEMRIYLEVTARIVLPFVTEKISISNVIPISMEVVQGSVPNGYITSFK